MSTDKAQLVEEASRVFAQVAWRGIGNQSTPELEDYALALVERGWRPVPVSPSADTGAKSANGDAGIEWHVQDPDGETLGGPLSEGQARSYARRYPEFYTLVRRVGSGPWIAVEEN